MPHPCLSVSEKAWSALSDARKPVTRGYPPIPTHSLWEWQTHRDLSQRDFGPVS